MSVGIASAAGGSPAGAPRARESVAAMAIVRHELGGVVGLVRVAS